MPRLFFLLGVLAVGPVLQADSICKPQAPCYAASSIVNSASYATGFFAPNGFITIYGTDLSYVTRSLGAKDVRNGRIPTNLGGVTVMFALAGVLPGDHAGSVPAPLFFVSPTQINVLAPSILSPGLYEVIVVRDGRRGPSVRIQLGRVAPAFFQLDAKTVIATRPDGSLVDGNTPARPGEALTLYGSGFGPSILDSDDGIYFAYDEAPARAASIRGLQDLRVLLNGIPLPTGNILYAGFAPGFAGLYQVNLLLPSALPSNPEIRVSLHNVLSAEEIQLPVSGGP